MMVYRASNLKTCSTSCHKGFVSQELHKENKGGNQLT